MSELLLDRAIATCQYREAASSAAKPTSPGGPIRLTATERRAPLPREAALSPIPPSGSTLGRNRSSGGWQERALRAAGSLPQGKCRRRVPFPDRTRRPRGRSLAGPRRRPLRHEPDHPERRQRDLGGEGLVVPWDRLGLDAAEVARVRPAVVGRIGVQALDPPARPRQAHPVGAARDRREVRDAQQDVAALLGGPA